MGDATLSGITATTGARADNAAEAEINPPAPAAKPMFPRFVDWIQVQFGLRDRNEDDDADLPKETDRRIRILARRRRQAQMLRTVQLLMFVVGLSLAGLGILLIRQKVWPEGPVQFGIGVFALLALTGLAGAAAKPMRIRDLESAIRDAEFERDVQSDASSPKVYAARLLGLNQQQLRAYYDVVLRQSKYIFVAGILCAAVGVGIVVYTISKLATSGTGLTAPQGIIAGVGTLTSLLTTYVAHIFLRMYGTIAATFGGFHGRLVVSNELLLANVLAAGVDDEAMRKELTRDVVLKLASRQVSELTLQAGDTSSTSDAPRPIEPSKPSERKQR